MPLVEQILHTGNVSCERVISRVHAGRRHVLSLWHGPSPPPPREIWADKDVAPVVIEGGDSSHEDHKTESGSHFSAESWNQQFPGSLIRSAHGRHFQYQPSDYSPKGRGRGKRGLLLRGEEGNKEEEGRRVSFFFFFLEKEFWVLCEFFLCGGRWDFLLSLSEGLESCLHARCTRYDFQSVNCDTFTTRGVFWHRRQKHRLCHQSSNALCLRVTQSRRRGHVLSAAVVGDGL